jgi:hypothetical protein
MRSRIAGGALALALAASLGGTGVAGAQDSQGASVTEVGWWTRVPVTSAPEGGFAVGRNVSGDATVAAIRVMVMAAPTSALLTAEEAGGLNASGADLQVCTTPNRWTGEEGGSFGDAPRPECEAGAVALERDDDGIWSADVSSLLEEGEVSLMVVPVEPETPTSPGFQVSFEPPELDAPAGTDTGASFGGASGPASPMGDTQGPGAGGGGTGSLSQDFSPPPAPAPTGGSFEPSAPPEPELPAPAGDDEGPAGDEEALGVPGSRPSRAQFDPLSSPALPASGRPWGQALFFVAVSTVAGVATAMGRRQLRTMGYIGAS